jgi:hypothetical protein
MVNKVKWVAITVGAVIVSCLILWAVFPVIHSLTQIAYTDPSAGNYPAYKAAVGAFPWWVFFLPVLVGTFAVAVILRMPERS